MTYKEQYLHPEWQKKRVEILNRDNFTCRYCEAKDITLHVHHREYHEGKKVWEYDNSYLVTLCKECHKNYEAELTFYCMLDDVHTHEQLTIPFQIVTSEVEILYKGKRYYLDYVIDDIDSFIYLFCTKEEQKRKQKQYRSDFEQ